MKKIGRPAMAKADRKVFKMIRIDADVYASIHEHVDRLEARLGFRPTITQALRHLITVRHQK
jgi:uncharacterized protein (DUF4415 family)